MKPVHIITPFFCQEGFNESNVEYFRLMLKTIQTAGYPFEWTIIDNNSSDKIVKWLKEEVESLEYVTRIIYNKENFGIGKAMNQGIDLGPIDYVLKLDADMSFYKEGWLKELVWAADNISDAGAFGISVEVNNYSVFEYKGRKYQNHLAHIGGACFLTPKRIFDIIGYWNEEYDPYGGTDGDYGMRIRYAGYKTIYLNDKEIAKHYNGLANPIAGCDGDPVYIDFKIQKRKENTKRLHENLKMYQSKEKSLKYIKNKNGNIISE